MIILIIIICELSFIIIVGSIKAWYERSREAQRKELIDNAKKNHTLASIFTSILFEEEINKKLK